VVKVRVAIRNKVALLAGISAIALMVPAVGASASLDPLATQSAAVAAGAQLTSIPSTVTPPVTQVTTQPFAGPGIATNCYVSAASTASIKPCALGFAGATKSIVLVGDSQAVTLASMFDSYAKKVHVRLVLLAKNGCPPWLVPVKTITLAPFPGCDAWHKFEIAAITKAAPSAIFVTGGFGMGGNATSVQKGAKALLTALAAFRARTMVLANVPWWTGTEVGPPLCYVGDPSNIQKCNRSTAAWASDYGWFRTAIKAATKPAGVRLLNTDRLLCTTSTCPVVISNHLVYYDKDHVSATYWLSIESAFQQLVVKTLAAAP
jgi:hypothetical protein